MHKKHLTITLALLILFSIQVFYSCKNDPKELENIFVDVSSDIANPKTYMITKASEEIDIDGIANEQDWQLAKYTDNFIDIEGIKTPKFDTRVKMLWDENYLYVYAELMEPHIWGDITERDNIIYLNNDFEIFMDPSGNSRNYGEIEINALGTEWDLFLDKPYGVGGNCNFHWNLNDLKTSVKIYGTINDHSDIDSMWTVEFAIPMRPLVELKVPPKTIPVEGEQWRINFSRVEWDYEIVDGKYQRKKENGTLLPEYNWVWSAQNVINMHQPDKWGFVQFTESSNGTDIDFIKDQDLIAKQILNSLFKKIRYGTIDELKNVDTYSQKVLDVKHSEAETIEALFCKTKLGFEIEITNPITNNTFVINEIGTLIQKHD